MDIMLEQIPVSRVAFIRKTGPYGISNIQTMEDLKKWARLNHLFDDESIILGIAQDDPKTTKAEACRYDTCIVISQDYSLTGKGVLEENIAGGKYAVFRIEHTAEAVRQAWADIFPELSRQGYGFDATRPIMERYKVQLINNHQCEICVPVV